MKIEPKNLDKVTDEVKKIADHLKTSDWVTSFKETEEGIKYEFLSALCRHDENQFMIDHFFSEFTSLKGKQKTVYTISKKLNDKDELIVDFNIKCKSNRCHCSSCPLTLAAYYKTRMELEQAVKNELISDPLIEAVETDEKELLKELDQMIYHESVKEQLKEVIKVMKYVRICREHDLETPTPDLNICLIINPGMKTYAIAKFINKVALKMELTKVSYPRYLSSEKNGYIYPDCRRINVLDELPKWEHQTSDSKSDDKQIKEIKKILTRLTDNPHGYMTIVQGTKNEVQHFFQENAKLQHTFTWRIIVPDLTDQELWEHFQLECEPYNYQFEEGFKEAFFSYLINHRKKSPYQNLDFVRYLFNTVMMNEMLENNGVHSVRVLKIEHLPHQEQQKYHLEESLAQLIGMEEIKESLRELETYLIYNKRIAPFQVKQPVLNLHMMFTGNPGTGKTTVARIVAELLFELGYLRENKCIEVERKDLVAAYLGQTALKTAKVIESAKGGVLFIDEAYSLAPKDGDKFGDEAIATLIKSMEDYKDELVVIVAGYEKEMQQFIDANSGIASRLGYKFNISDYSDEELLAIAQLRFETMGYSLETEVMAQLRDLIKEGMTYENFGNARFVVNLIQKIIIRHAKRSLTLPDDALFILTKEDLISKEEVRKMLESENRTDVIGFKLN